MPPNIRSFVGELRNGTAGLLVFRLRARLPKTRSRLGIRLRKQGIRREDRLLHRNSAMFGRCEQALPRIHPEGCRKSIHDRLGWLYLGKHFFHQQKQPLSDDPIPVRRQVNVVAEGLLRSLVEDIG
jgi:hypothetical protein